MTKRRITHYERDGHVTVVLDGVVEEEATPDTCSLIVARVTVYVFPAGDRSRRRELWDGMMKVYHPLDACDGAEVTATLNDPLNLSRRAPHFGRRDIERMFHDIFPAEFDADAPPPPAPPKPKRRMPTRRSRKPRSTIAKYLKGLP